MEPLRTGKTAGQYAHPSAHWTCPSNWIPAVLRRTAFLKPSSFAFPLLKTPAHSSVDRANLMEKAMAIHSSALAWKIPWTPGRLQSMGSLRVGHDCTFTFHFHAMEKEMATHSSVLAWRIPGTGEPGGLPSMRSHRVGHD